MFDLASIGNADTGSSISDALSGNGLGKDDFFRLLIEQLKNQDPLEPMKNQEFAAQLAQFSSLEKLDNINSNIEQGTQIDLVLTQAINNSAAATIVGRTVKAWGDQIHVKDGTSSYDLSFNLQSDAANVTVEVVDSDGNTVRTIDATEMSAGDHTLTWDGKNSSGEDVKNGSYTLKVTAKDSNDVDITARAYTHGTIEGIRYKDGNAMLIVDGDEIPFSSILEIGLADTNG